MLRFDIAGILMEVESENRLLFEQMNLFQSRRRSAPDIRISLHSCERIDKPQGEVIIEDEVIWVKDSAQDSHYSIFFMNEVSRRTVAKLKVNKDWSNASITCIKDSPGGESAIAGLLGSILVRNRILYHDGFVIHASAVERDNKSILFSAPSGTGKSTHARTWEKYGNARVLNDDCPAVRILENIPIVFGTPWSGSTDKFINASAPLSAIVILEQAPENAIFTLSKSEAFLHLMPRCFLPYFDRDLLNTAIGHLERVISSVPVYKLKCKPDRAAMELVYQCVR
ncbi:MAG: hypothetical protein N2484_04140 [Clostridia bacterium]|nr:hypothetical protein [Clostridia bacterium]